MKRIGRLHVLTDTVLQSRFSHEEIARLAIVGGADTIQFRQKLGKTRDMIEVCRRMKTLCAAAGVAFIVNDRMDVAIASEADGVHLGQEDFPIPLARRLLGRTRLIGGSACDLEEARRCVDEGADYVGFGPVYPTASKQDAGPVGGLELLGRAVREIPIPIIAIGGITAANAGRVLAAGAKGVAVISAVCCRKDPESATKELWEAIRGEG